MAVQGQIAGQIRAALVATGALDGITEDNDCRDNAIDLIAGRLPDSL